jgi:hypothetical protein
MEAIHSDVAAKINCQGPKLGKISWVTTPIGSNEKIIPSFLLDLLGSLIIENTGDIA